MNWKKCTLFDVNFRPQQLTAEELRQGFQHLALKLYSDECTEWRRNRFKSNLRRTRNDGRVHHAV